MTFVKTPEQIAMIEALSQPHFGDAEMLTVEFFTDARTVLSP